MKCPGCNAIIDDSYVETFAKASSVNCPACGFMLEINRSDLMSTASEFRVLRGWTVRLAKGQEVHFDTEEAFSNWLKHTTVSPGDQISNSGSAWENLGTYLLGQRKQHSQSGDPVSHGFQVPPNTLDAPDPEDELEEMTEIMDAASDTDQPEQVLPPIMSTKVGHERRLPPPVPGSGAGARVVPPSLPPAAKAMGSQPSSTTAPSQKTEPEVGQGIDAEQRTLPKTDSPRPSPADEQKAPKPAHVAPKPTLQTRLPLDEKKNTGMGLSLAALVFGALVGVVVDRLVRDVPRVSNPVEVVTKPNAKPTLDLSSREVLAVGERWGEYLALPSSEPTQLTTRLSDKPPVTVEGKRVERAYLALAFLADLARNENSMRDGSLGKAYTKVFSQKNRMLLDRLLPLLKSTTAKPNVMAKSVEPSRDASDKQDVPQKSSKADRVESGTPASKTEVARLPEKGKSTRPSAKPSTGASQVSDAGNLLSRGQKALEKGRLAEARAFLAQALAKQPNSHKGHMLVGYLELNQRKYDAALKAFSRARKIKPRDRETLLGIGSTYEKKGDFESARKTYATYKEIFTGPRDQQRIEYKLEKLNKK